MSDSKKKRMSMLDTLAASGSPAPASMMSTNRALRSARDAVDAHRVWDLDPAQIIDERPVDRLDPGDVADLRASIEANGQSVPILVRRDPADPERYRLVYGARRLTAIRLSDSVKTVRALIAQLDDEGALRAQVTENAARRDLSFIERALFAVTLSDSGFGTQTQIAEVLNATKSAVSMAISIARTIGEDLAVAIGPAHGIGRPRWEALAADLATNFPDREELHRIARNARLTAQLVQPDEAGLAPDPSVAAFESVARAAHRRPSALPRLSRPSPHLVHLGGQPVGQLRRTPLGLRLDLMPPDPDFADWFAAQAQSVLDELFDRWRQQSGGAHVSPTINKGGTTEA